MNAEIPLYIMPDHDTKRYREKVVRDIAREIRDTEILVCPVDYGGRKGFANYADLLRGEGKVLGVADLGPQEMDLVHGEFRPISTHPDKVLRVKEDEVPKARKMLLFDRSGEGPSVMGGVVWALSYADDLGIQEVCVALEKDQSGVANFCLYRFTTEFTGPRNYLLEQMPRTVESLSDNLHILSEREPGFYVDVSECEEIGSEEGDRWPTFLRNVARIFRSGESGPIGLVRRGVDDEEMWRMALD